MKTDSESLHLLILLYIEWVFHVPKLINWSEYNVVEGTVRLDENLIRDHLHESPEEILAGLIIHLPYNSQEVSW